MSNVDVLHPSEVPEQVKDLENQTDFSRRTTEWILHQLVMYASDMNQSQVKMLRQELETRKGFDGQ